MMTMATDPIMLPSVSFKVGMKKNLEVDHFEHAFGLYPKYGYWVVLLPDDCDAIDIFMDDGDNTYVMVNIFYMEYGCLFLMQPFVQSILVECKVCMIQVVPYSLRKIFGFIYICEWLNFLHTINLFKACFKIKNSVKCWSGFVCF